MSCRRIVHDQNPPPPSSNLKTNPSPNPNPNHNLTGNCPDIFQVDNEKMHYEKQEPVLGVGSLHYQKTQRLTDFWINKNDILRLYEWLQLSESTACCLKSRCDCNVVLCIFLKKILYYRYRYKDMVPLFGWNPSELCSIFTLYFIYQIFRQRLETWDLYFLQLPYLQRCRYTSLKTCTL